MTEEKKPRKFQIIDKVSKDEDVSENIVPILEEKIDLGGIIVHDGLYGEEDEDVEAYDDSDIFNPEMAGYDPRITDELDAAHAAEEFLMDCAVEWLPQLPQITILIENNIRLDYGVLMGAKIVFEEMKDRVNEQQLDAMIAATLLFGEETPQDMKPYYDMLTTEAQDFAHALDQALEIDNKDELEGSPYEGRLLMFAAITSDIEIAADFHQTEGEEPTYAEMHHFATLIESLSGNGDLPANLIKRVGESFNTLARVVDMPIYLQPDGYRLTLADGPPIPVQPYKPPRP